MRVLRILITTVGFILLAAGSIFGAETRFDVIPECAVPQDCADGNPTCINCPLGPESCGLQGWTFALCPPFAPRCPPPDFFDCPPPGDDFTFWQSPRSPTAACDDGYLRFIDCHPNNPGLICAPGSFLGDWSGLDGVGELCYDFRVFQNDTGIGAIPYTVYIFGFDQSGVPLGATFEDGTPAGVHDWTTIQVLIEKSMWKNFTTGEPINDTDWSSLLSNVTDLVIKTELFNNPAICDERTGVDNIRLGANLVDCQVVAPCDPAPLTQGYWHRQCLGAGLIASGRNGRGPAELLEPDFLKTLVPAVDARLQATIFLPPTFDTCEDGMDAVPSSDKCEKALKQYTALLLNLESGRLQNSCDLELSVQGCSAATIADLVDELAALINTGDRDNCRVASDCAGAVNENQGIVVPAASPIAPSGELSLFGVGLDIATSATSSDVPSVGTTADSPQQTPVVDASPATPASEPVSATDKPEVLTADAPAAVDSSTPALIPYISNVGSSVAPQVAGEEAIDDAAAEVTDTPKTIEPHLAVIANASAPARARRTSEDALLTALGGGYEPEVRLQIVRGLLGKVDVAYNTLLAKHLEDIFLGAQEFGNKKVAREAARLLKSLEPSRESTE
jgi:hypothetical protein